MARAIEAPSLLADPPATAHPPETLQTASSPADIATNGDAGREPRTTRESAINSPPVQTQPTNYALRVLSQSMQPPSHSSTEMQPPPAKRQRLHNYDRRPRLSICPSVSPDPELVEDRDRNDNTLKSKFEAIFEKYGRDFSNIGDEINVMTGEVIVDNGHILSMQDEKDPGSPSRARPRVSRAPGDVHSVPPIRRDCRSVTVGTEDVIASIEAMGRRIATGQTPYPEEGDIEDLYESVEEMTTYRRGSVSSDSLLGIAGDDYQNAWESQRSGSPDSLLGYEEQDSSIESFYDEQATLPPKAANNNLDNTSSNEPVLLISEPISAPTSDPEVLAARPAGPHGHPVTSFEPPSPPAFVKSNGKQKIVLKKFNVSKAYEELQRQALTTPATNPFQLSESLTTIAGDKSSWSSTRSKCPSRKAPPATESQQGRETSISRNTSTILKRLPVARPSSEPRTMEGEYESDDPLQ